MKNNKFLKEIISRAKAPTPKFWKKNRNYMIAIGGCSTLILLGSSFLPLILVKIASYGLVTGTVGTALSQMGKVKEDDDKPEKLTRIQEQRKKTMLTLIELHNFFIDESNKCGMLCGTKNPIFMPNWLDEKFDRFHIVESTSHYEEKFKVNCQLRYTLRSKEAHAYGSGHQAYYDRYLSTISVSLEDIENPEAYKAEIIENFKKYRDQHNGGGTDAPE